VALTPQTLVGRVATSAVQRNISYGYTSALTARAAAWATAALGRTGVQSAPSTVSTPNIVTLLVNQTTLINFNDSSGMPTLRFMPVGRVPELIGVAYPSCTGSSYRHGAQRTHGKRTGLHHLGLIVSADIPDISTSLGLANQTWNPLAEFIFDVVERWEDQTCVCHEEWTYSPEATPPTCKRAWGAFGSWLADTHPEPTVPTAPFSLTVSRSLVGTTVRPSGGPLGEGGFYVQDAGGISLVAFGSDASSVYAGQTTRGPWRTSADGSLTFSTVGPQPVRLATAICVRARRTLLTALSYRTRRLCACQLRDLCPPDQAHEERCGIRGCRSLLHRASRPCSALCSVRPRSAVTTSAWCVSCVAPAPSDTDTSSRNAAEPLIQRGDSHPQLYGMLNASGRRLRARLV